MIIFPDIPNVEVEGIVVVEEIKLTLHTASPTASCPSCGTASSRIQSWYTRTLRDLPSVGRPIHLIMHMRRFFSKNRTCVQKIFVERLPDLCYPHAQRTKRLQKALRELGLKIGAKQERMLEMSSAPAGVAIRSCVWFANRNSLLSKSHTS